MYDFIKKCLWFEGEAFQTSEFYSSKKLPEIEHVLHLFYSVSSTVMAMVKTSTRV